MIRINEEEEEEEDIDDKTPTFSLETTESNKQIDRPKSLSPRKSPSSSFRSHSNENHSHHQQRRRYASDSYEQPNRQSSATFLVTSFLQYLRNQLRATTNIRKNDYQQFIRQKFVFDIQSKMSNGNRTEINDENEILTLIDLLVLRVECLTNENQTIKKKKKKKFNENYPSVSQVDQNLIEYLYYLFTKFTHEEQMNPIVDKSNFVNVCQTLVRNGCFDISSSSPDQSTSDTTITEQTIIHEYPTTIDNDKDTWLVVDFDQTKENLIIPNSPSDDQLLSLNENDKSYESFSSPSIYLSPNTSLIDLQNLVQDFDEHNQQDETISTSNVTIDSKTGLFNDENIYIGLTNDQDSNENNEQLTIEVSEQMSQREKKMQDRWSRSITADGTEQTTNKPLLGIDFPQISVLRRKFSTSKKSNTEEINTSSSTTTVLVDTTNPDQINELPSKDFSSSIANTELEATNVDRQQTENLSDSEECQTETITNPDETSSLTLTNTSELLSLSSVNEMNVVESIEREEEEKKERCNDDYNVDEEKKNNNSNFVYDNHASGILLINDEPTQTALLVEQEKKEEDEEKEKKNEEERERPSPPLQTLEQSNQQRTTEDESPIQILSNDSQQLNQSNIMDETNELYKKVEIEEIPDEDEDETLLTKNIESIEPVDFIRTDDEEKKVIEKKSSPPRPSSNSDKGDPLLSCYEKAFSKVVERTFDDSPSSTTALQPTVDDPIALRALQRFQERMNAVSSTSTNTIKDDSTNKGKSSWSSSISAQRKSMENLFKNSELQPIPTHTETVSTNESQNDAEQSQTTATVETDDKRVVENEDDKSNAIECSTIADDSGITPYRFQIEGRRRLNTIDRLRERRQSRDLLEQQQSNENKQLQADYSVKTEEVQDPIVRRALERFDEKNRTLAQTKSMNYDDIQDPITRRALMRLESNLKRTLPTNNIQSNENWYTENYTLGSLQPSTNKTKYISVHQHYCTPSSNELTESNNGHTEQDLSMVRSTAQPIYLTSTNQPLSFRQRSRSEDMLSSKDLSIGQTTNLDEVDTSSTITATSSNQLQRNRSSNEIALNEPNHLLPNTIIKALEPTFVRTTESAVSYVTPTQTYSAYSCEYTRPRRNPMISSTEALNSNEKEFTTLPPSKPPQIQNDVQRPAPYRPFETSSYTPMQTSNSTATSTSNYYGQQSIPSSSYTSNNFYQSSTSEDPIIRRALDRFNNQVQNSYLSRPANPSDSYLTSSRSNLMTTSTNSSSNNNTNTSTGYQSIIGRRRQTRQDEPTHYFADNPSIGDGYTSSYFANSQNSYPTTTRYMELTDQPPIVPPRLRRFEETYDQYRRHSTDDFLTENYNNNNNNNNNNINSQTLPRDPFIHHAYPATITNSNGFRPINVHYNQDEYFDRAQSTSSTNSSESYQRSRQQMKIQSPDNSALGLLSDGTSSGGDSGFHRLAYTGTKASLSKSSSNLLNKNSSQPSTNQMQTCEIDIDESTNSTTNEQTKYPRSKSVDPRGRLKLTQTRTADNEQDQFDDQQSTIVPSSKFTPIHTRPPPRVPLTPTTTPRTMPNKRPSNGNHFSYSKSSNGNIYDQDIENEENIQYQDENRERISIPVYRYNTNNNNNNNIQSSPSTSSMNSNLSRTKPPVSTPMNFERRESNGSITDTSRVSRRSDDHRLVSPGGQRRNVPVSVFTPTKIENKRPAPAPPTSTTIESQQSSGQKTPTSSLLLNEFPTTTTDKSDNPKKMNVFERLFRGNKKKT